MIHQLCDYQQPHHMTLEFVFQCTLFSTKQICQLLVQLFLFLHLEQ